MRISCWPQAVTRLKNLSRCRASPPPKSADFLRQLNPGFLHMAAAPAGLPLPAEFPQGRIILTVGRWAASEQYKGADELIGAAAQLRASVAGLRMVAVGGGDDLPRLRKIARELGMAECVHFLLRIYRANRSQPVMQARRYLPCPAQVKDSGWSFSRR